MKINYRGISYEYNPPEVAYGDLTQSGKSQLGKYRGVDVRFRNPQKSPVLQPTLDLVYRGVAYTNNAPEAEVAEVSQAPALTVQDRARTLMMDHHRKVKQRQQAMLSRVDAQIGLPIAEAARFWNHIQGKVHPSFGDSYDRSSATLS